MGYTLPSPTTLTKADANTIDLSRLRAPEYQRARYAVASFPSRAQAVSNPEKFQTDGELRHPADAAQRQRLVDVDAVPPLLPNLRVLAFGRVVGDRLRFNTLAQTL